MTTPASRINEIVRRHAAMLSVLSVLALAPLFLPAVAGADNYLTQSQRVLCAVTPDSSLESFGPDVVVCQGGFVQAPEIGASPLTTGDGTIHWKVGNIAIYSPTTEMKYGATYRWGNWMIYHDTNGTRITHSRTGHGMFVSIENVYPF